MTTNFVTGAVSTEGWRWGKRLQGCIKCISSCSLDSLLPHPCFPLESFQTTCKVRMHPMHCMSSMQPSPSAAFAVQCRSPTLHSCIKYKSAWQWGKKFFFFKKYQKEKWVGGSPLIWIFLSIEKWIFWNLVQILKFLKVYFNGGRSGHLWGVCLFKSGCFLENVRRGGGESFLIHKNSLQICLYS